MRRSAAGLLIALVLGHACHARAACRIHERAEVALEHAGSLLIVPLMLNEKPARFLLDTGAERTVVTIEAARRLDLARDEWVATTMRAANGALERNRNANPRSLTLGGVALRRRSIARDSSLAVTTPTALPNTNVDGLLGRDFLASFDLALDSGANTLRLYDVAGCSGRFLPWSEPYLDLPMVDLVSGMRAGTVAAGDVNGGSAAIGGSPIGVGAKGGSPIAGNTGLRGGSAAAGRKPQGSAIILQAEVDGVPLRALLDTGASHGLVAAPGMHRLGLTLSPSDAPARIGMSAAMRPMDGRVRRFGMLRVGSELDGPVTMLVAPVRLVPTADMILGADWLRGRAVWISFQSDQIFVTPRIRTGQN